MGFRRQYELVCAKIFGVTVAVFEGGRYIAAEEKKKKKKKILRDFVRNGGWEKRSDYHFLALPAKPQQVILCFQSWRMTRKSQTSPSPSSPDQPNPKYWISIGTEFTHREKAAKDQIYQTTVKFKSLAFSRVICGLFLQFYLQKLPPTPTPIPIFPIFLFHTFPMILTISLPNETP